VSIAERRPLDQPRLTDPLRSEITDASFRVRVAPGREQAQRGQRAERGDAATRRWSSMHGLVALTPKLANMSTTHRTPDGRLDDTVARFTELLVDGLRNSRRS